MGFYPKHLFTFILFLTFIELFLCYKNCENQIIDKSGSLTPQKLNKLSSEVKTWEGIVSSLPSSCWNNQSEDLHTCIKVLIYENGQGTDINLNGNVWMTGRCENTSIFLYSNVKKGCDALQIAENEHFALSNNQEKNVSLSIDNFISHMVMMFFSLTVTGNQHLIRYWNVSFWPGCKFLTGNLAVPTQLKNFTPIHDNTSTPNLTRHHGHGSVIDAVITIIGVVCGGTVLTSLLIIKRVRHCICTACGLCRDSERLLSYTDL